jgi:hypothetical protein
VSEKLKFLWRNSDAGTRQRRAGNVRVFRSDDVHGARQRRADAGPTAAPHRLHFAIMAPHDDAAGVGLATFACVTYQEHDSETIGPETEDACAMIIG